MSASTVQPSGRDPGDRQLKAEGRGAESESDHPTDRPAHESDDQG